MRHRHSRIVVFAILFTLSNFYSSCLNAQDFYHDDSLIRDTANVFCKQLSMIMKQTDSRFDKIKDSLVDTSGQKTWTCKENYKLDGARSCAVFQRGLTTEFAAVFLSRDSKDELASSYRNLCHQLKDCLGQYYVYKDKKATTAEAFMGVTNYECRITPYGDAVPEQSELLVSIQEDGQSGNYMLILEIKKYKGYY